MSCVEIWGANVGLRDVMYKVLQVASLDSPVLLLDEPGTGKDVIANAAHYSLSRPPTATWKKMVQQGTFRRELKNVIERAIILNPKGP